MSGRNLHSHPRFWKPGNRAYTDSTAHKINLIYYFFSNTVGQNDTGKKDEQFNVFELNRYISHQVVHNMMDCCPFTTPRKGNALCRIFSSVHELLVVDTARCRHHYYYYYYCGRCSQVYCSLLSALLIVVVSIAWSAFLLILYFLNPSWSFTQRGLGRTVCVENRDESGHKSELNDTEGVLSFHLSLSPF